MEDQYPIYETYFGLEEYVKRSVLMKFLTNQFEPPNDIYKGLEITQLGEIGNLTPIIVSKDKLSDHTKEAVKHLTLKIDEGDSVAVSHLARANSGPELTSLMF